MGGQASVTSLGRTEGPLALNILIAFNFKGSLRRSLKKGGNFFLIIKKSK